MGLDMLHISQYIVGTMKDPIVQDGDPVLRMKAAPVPKKDISSRKIQALIAKMKKALAAEEFGVALAAPQLGEPLRIFVVAGSVFQEKKDEQIPSPPDRVFINPTLTRLSKKKVEMSEGCLSVRGKYGTVIRHEKATVKAQDEQGNPITYHGSGLVGHIFQHECDHLDGILYIDKAVHIEEDEDMQSARAKLKEKHGV
ncbi:peptide deformylase [Candidatus Kaiserbacteria bacterium]|nr:peptide deformylase [Candidatus Kaiserbacteria bacterium]